MVSTVLATTLDIHSMTVPVVWSTPAVANVTAMANETKNNRSNKTANNNSSSQPQHMANCSNNNNKNNNEAREPASAVFLDGTTRMTTSFSSSGRAASPPTTTFLAPSSSFSSFPMAAFSRSFRFRKPSPPEEGGAMMDQPQQQQQQHHRLASHSSICSLEKAVSPDNGGGGGEEPWSFGMPLRDRSFSSSSSSVALSAGTITTTTTTSSNNSSSTLTTEEDLSSPSTFPLTSVHNSCNNNNNKRRRMGTQPKQQRHQSPRKRNGSVLYVNLFVVDPSGVVDVKWEERANPTAASTHNNSNNNNNNHHPPPKKRHSNFLFSSRPVRMAASFVAKRILTPEKVAKIMADLVPDKIMARSLEKGIHVTARVVFQQGPYVVLELQVQTVDLLQLLQSSSSYHCYCSESPFSPPTNRTTTTKRTTAATSRNQKPNETRSCWTTGGIFCWNQLMTWLQWTGFVLLGVAELLCLVLGLDGQKILEECLLPPVVQRKMERILHQMLAEELKEEGLDAISAVLPESKQARFFFDHVQRIQPQQQPSITVVSVSSSVPQPGQQQHAPSSPSALHPVVAPPPSSFPRQRTLSAPPMTGHDSEDHVGISTTTKTTTSEPMSSSSASSSPVVLWPVTAPTEDGTGNGPTATTTSSSSSLLLDVSPSISSSSSSTQQPVNNNNNNNNNNNKRPVLMTGLARRLGQVRADSKTFLTNKLPQRSSPTPQTTTTPTTTTTSTSTIP